MAKKKEAVAYLPPAGAKKVPKEIAIKLTQEQILAKGEENAKLSQERRALEAEFKDEEAAWKQRKAQHKAALKANLDQSDRLSDEIKAGAAKVNDDAYLVLNHNAGIAEYHYQTKGKDKPFEIFETRALMDNERQLSMIEDQVKNLPDEGQEIEEE